MLRSVEHLLSESANNQFKMSVEVVQNAEKYEYGANKITNVLFRLRKKM